MLETIEVNNPRLDHQVIYNCAEQAKAFFVFAHGAGADMNHEFMSQVASLLNDKHISVLRFNFPYMVKRAEDGKRRPPDRMPKLIEHFVSVISNIETKLPLFIGGKSMGGRVAATLMNKTVSEGVFNQLKGGVCLGYPFHPQKKPEKLRLEPLQENQKKLLIIQGERDALGNKEEISGYQLSPLCQLLFLEDGDHSLKPRVKSGFTHQQHINTCVLAIESFIDENS